MAPFELLPASLLHPCLGARVKWPEHGVKLADAPWARKGSAFTLLFEQAALTLVREMPVNAAAKIIEITDKCLWRIVQHYVAKSPMRMAVVAPAVRCTPQNLF